MKQLKHFVLPVILLVSSHLLYGQKDAELELKDLNLPNTPAFTLLDYSPTVIDRPGTAKTFATNIVSLLGQSQSLPKNFAMEVSPFWLFKSKLTVYKYHGINESKSKQQNIFANVRNASISIGSVYKDSSKTHAFDANYIAIGGRVNLIKVIRKPTIAATISTIKGIAARQVTLVAPVTGKCIGVHSNTSSPEYKECVKKGLEDAFSKDEQGMVVLEKRMQQILEINPLFQMDVAFATSRVFKDNTLDSDRRYRTGVWTTMELSLPLTKSADVEKLIENKNYINIYGTLRYMNEDSTTDFKTFHEQKLLDFGGRFELEFDKLSISFETIHRVNRSNEDLNTSRNVGILQYKINDRLYLSGTFGKNFGTVRNVIALFGLNWGFGKQSLTEK
ncbi:MAG: hypothetical protein JNK14_07680 [Chitinophagaceae bacterium]|nr:hypothetical protein [Chitinophagaceae bacterium]